MFKLFSRKSIKNINCADTFLSRFDSVKSEMDNMLKMKDSLFLFKSYLNHIFYSIEQYKKSSSEHLDLSTRLFNDAIRLKFDKLNSDILGFISFLEKISKNNQLEFIMQNSYSESIATIESFIKNFNFDIVELKLFVGYTHPISTEPDDIALRQIRDTKNYLEFINDSIKNNRFSKKVVATLKQRLKEADDRLQVLQTEELKIQKKRLKMQSKIDRETFERKIKKITNSIIDYNDIEIQNILGNGSEGSVFLGYLKSTQRCVAVKRLKTQSLSYKMYYSLKRQIKMMTELNHFAIIHFVGITLDPLCIITNCMSHGSLYDRLQNKSGDNFLTPTKRTIIALGIAYALNFMHKRNPPILHCDIKSLNVLLDSEDFPQLCDFGLSHYKNEVAQIDMMGFGTVNWMAPEMIKGYELTEKSDVFSYGVLLWELLTSNSPFTDFPTPSKIAEAIAFNGIRLDIQRRDCPQELRSLMAACWNADPKNRPTFDDIIEKFESGTVKFIGTQTDQVKAYVTLHQDLAEDEECFDFPTITNSIINSICNELDANKEVAVLKANSILMKEENHQFILQFNLIKSLVNAIDNCDSARYANYLIKTADIICKNKCLLDAFQKENGVVKFIKLFTKFGPTAKKNIILTLSFFAQNVEGVVFNYNAIAKISPFLLFNNLNCRLNSLKLLNMICDMKCYDSENSFNVILRNVLCNVFPKAKTDIINESLDLLLKIVKLSDMNLSILASEGIKHLIALINHQESGISIKSMKIIEELLKLTVTHKNVVFQILSFLPEISESKNNEEIKEYLKVLAYLLKMKVTLLEKIQSDDSKSIIGSFKSFLTSDDVEIVINSLKLCFSFLYHSATLFDELHDTFCTLLSHENKSIRILAASCLTLVFQHAPFDMSNESSNNQIGDFLKESLSKSDEEVDVQILDLCGVISTSFDGTLFIESFDIIQFFPKLISDNLHNSRISRTVSMILASLSALNPLCDRISDAFPIVFNMLKNNLNSPYPIIFISNMAVIEDGAFECAKYISDIVKNAEFDFQRSIIAIERIMTDQKAKEIMFNDNDEVLDLLMSLLLNKWNSDSVFLSVVDQIASVDAGKKAILDSEIKNVIVKQFNEIDLNNDARPILVRILSRVQS